MTTLFFLLGTALGFIGYISGILHMPALDVVGYVDAAQKDSVGVFIAPETQPNLYPIRDWSVPQPVLGAISAALYDVQSGRFLYMKNIDEHLPIASVTKLMTAMVTLDNFQLADETQVSGTAIAKSTLGEGGSQLTAGEVLSIEQVLKLLLISSSNDAAYVLEELLKKNDLNLVDSMNAKAKQLDMKDTFFSDPSGLDDAVAYSSARDVIKMARETLKYPAIGAITSTARDSFTSLDGVSRHNLTSTNSLLETTSGIVGGKTGYTDIARGAIVVMRGIDEDDVVVAVVLESEDRFGDMSALLDWADRGYKWNETSN